MYKKFDISKKVMKQVAGFEKKRSIRRLIEILSVIIIVLIPSLIFLYLAISDIINQRSLDMLSIFGEDPEIVGQYWKDTLSTFWQELPQEKILIGITFLTFAIILLIIFRKKIRVIFKRLKSLKKLK